MFYKKNHIAFILIHILIAICMPNLTAQNSTLKLDEVFSCNKNLSRYSQICSDYENYNGSLNQFQFLFEGSNNFSTSYISYSSCLYLDNIAGLVIDSTYNVKVRGITFSGDTIPYGEVCSLKIVKTKTQFSDYLYINDDTINITSFSPLFNSGIGSGTYDIRDSVYYHVFAKNLLNNTTYFIDTLVYPAVRPWDIINLSTGLYSFKIRAEAFGNILEYGDSIIVKITGDLPSTKLLDVLCERDSFSLGEFISSNFIGLLKYQYRFIDVEGNDTIFSPITNSESVMEGGIFYQLSELYGFKVNHQYQVNVRNILPNNTITPFGPSCTIIIVDAKFKSETVEMDIYVDTSRVSNNDETSFSMDFGWGYNASIDFSKYANWSPNLSFKTKFEKLIDSINATYQEFSASGIYNQTNDLLGIKLKMNTPENGVATLISTVPYHIYDKFAKYKFSTSLNSVKGNPQKFNFKPRFIPVLEEDTIWFNVSNTDVYIDDKASLNVFGNSFNKGLINNNGRFLNSGVIKNIDTIKLVSASSIIITNQLQLDSGIVFIANNSIQLFKNDSTALIYNEGGIIFSDTATSGKIVFNNNPVEGHRVIPSFSSNFENVFIILNIVNKGLGNGQVSVGTYQTNANVIPNNIPYPSGITSLGSLTGGADNSKYVADRYWLVDFNGYNQKPNYNISFKYNNANILGQNEIDEDSLVAQLYDGEKWTFLPSTINVAQNNATLNNLNIGGVFVILDKNHLLDSISKMLVIVDIDNAAVNANNGSINLSISGGIPPYKILWSDINYIENYNEWRNDFDSAFVAKNSITENEIEIWYQNIFKETLRKGLQKGLYTVIVKDSQFRQKEISVKVGEQMNWIFSSDIVFSGDSIISKNDSTDLGGLVAGNLLIDSLATGYIEFSIGNYYSEQLIGFRSQGTVNENNFYTQMPIQSGTSNFYFFRIQGNTYSIFENESNNEPLGVYNTSDVFKVQKDNDYIKYYKNNDLIKTTSLASNVDLIALSKLVKNSKIKNLKSIKYQN